MRYRRSLTLRDARVLRNYLVATEDCDAASHACARGHGRYYGVNPKVDGWFKELLLRNGPQAATRR